MVLKTTICRFSGLRIYPGRGILYIRTDGQQYLFINQKCKSMFLQRKRPAKIAWTTTYRKQHKKVGGHLLCAAASAIVWDVRTAHMQAVMGLLVWVSHSVAVHETSAGVCARAHLLNNHV